MHQEKIEQGNLDTKQAQVDEIRVKAREMVIWMGLAIMAPTRLWIAGLVSETRDSNFTDELMLRVRKCCLALSAILICVDGLRSYPKSILKANLRKSERQARAWSTKKRSVAGCPDWGRGEAYGEKALERSYS